MCMYTSESVCLRAIERKTEHARSLEREGGERERDSESDSISSRDGRIFAQICYNLAEVHVWWLVCVCVCVCARAHVRALYAHTNPNAHGHTCSRDDGLHGVIARAHECVRDIHAEISRGAN